MNSEEQASGLPFAPGEKFVLLDESDEHPAAMMQMSADGRNATEVGRSILPLSGPVAFILALARVPVLVKHEDGTVTLHKPRVPRKVLLADSNGSGEGRRRAHVRNGSPSPRLETRPDFYMTPVKVEKPEADGETQDSEPIARPASLPQDSWTRLDESVGSLNDLYDRQGTLLDLVEAVQEMEDDEIGPFLTKRIKANRVTEVERTISTSDFEGRAYRLLQHYEARLTLVSRAIAAHKRMS